MLQKNDSPLFRRHAGFREIGMNRVVETIDTKSGCHRTRGAEMKVEKPPMEEAANLEFVVRA